MSTRTTLAAAAALAVLATAGAVPAMAKSHATAQVACYGVNSCKGTSDCKTAHNDCKGMNSCKGQACAAAGGSLTPTA